MRRSALADARPLSSVDAVVLLGAGGVGKTSVSAAMGVAAARHGRNVIVLTVDPARRLMETLGLTSVYPSEVVELSGMGTHRGSVHATMLDPSHTLAGLIDEFAPTPGRAAAIHRNRLFQSLLASLSGLNEYMAAERFRQLLGDPRFDLVIVDTPPSQNGVEFLDAPRRLTNLVDHRVYRTLLAPRRGLLRTVNAATALLARLIGKIVGAALLADVIEFFGLFEGMDAGFRDRAEEVHLLLRAPSTHVALVTTARPPGLRTAVWLGDQLHDRSVTPSALIINRRRHPVPRPPGSAHAALHAAVDEHNAIARSEQLLLADEPLVQELPVIEILETNTEDPKAALSDLAASLFPDEG